MEDPMTAHAMPMTDTLTRGGLRRRLLATERDWGATVARVALGAVMFPHGAQKLLGWFGGYGFRGTMGFLTAQAGLPYPIALLVILIESIGSLALIVGLAGRVAAAGVAGLLGGALVPVPLHNRFFMNWGGTPGGEGFGYPNP